MRKGLVVASVGVIAAMLALPSQGSSTGGGQPPTTLDKTIVAKGERKLAYTDGQKYVTRVLGAKAPKGKLKTLVGFKQVSDIHVVDEESPARVEYFDNCDSSVSSAYRPQEAMSAQVGESMLNVLSRITRGPATGMPLDFTISTGDNIDNNQYNELRWFIDLLDGKKIVPDSGEIGAYHGYTQDYSDSALSDELLLMAQEGFNATGTQQPWYAVLGNHDGLAQGNIRETLEFQLVAKRGDKVFIKIEDYEGCPEDPTDVAQFADAFAEAYANSTQEVPEDGDRRLLTTQELHEEYFTTSGKPKGHGLNLAPDYPYVEEGDEAFPAGYYEFPVADDIVGISMDTVSYDYASDGQIDSEQFKWIEETLKKYSPTYYDANGELQTNDGAKEKMIVMFSHHQSTALDNGTVVDHAPEGWGPVHCFEPTDDEGCAPEGLKDLLHRFPNVVAWINGHGHRNKVLEFPSERDPSVGFWEINTAAHIDWPQQSRLLEFAFKNRPNGKDVLVIYGTMVDHGAAPTPNLNKQDPIEYLASLSRLESYYDACVRENQAECEATGTPKDQNVRLVMKAPFDL